MRLPALFAVALALVAAPALAQEITPAMEADLWCGAAFDLALRDVPDTAAAEVKAVTDPYREGKDMLIGRARAAYLEVGYTEEAFNDLLAETETDVQQQLSSTDPAITPPFRFEDCAALIGQ